jgi:ATP-dependent helicase/nuclease subunit B
VALRVTEHRFGDDSFVALRAAVAAAKGVDPLLPVTVVVDRGTVGLATRRRLAAEPPGVANVRFLKWPALAAELAAPRLVSDGRRVVTGTIELEAVRSVLATGRPPLLAGARDQAGTARALARTYRELASVPSGALGDLARQGPRAAAVVEVVRAARARLATCRDDADLLRAAAAEVAAAPARASRACGAVVVLLPATVAPSERDLIDALADALDVEVVVGTTGDAEADAGARALAASLRPAADAPSTVLPPEPATPTFVQMTFTDALVPVGRPAPAAAGAPPPDPASGSSLRVCSAPTADAEVLVALRQLMRRNEEGTPLERMALLHSGVPPYPMLVHDALAVAGVPAHGGDARLLSATVPGRVLVGALGLGDHGWRRDDVMAWLASGPLLFDGRPVPAAEWDVLSCTAGIVSGLEEWDDRLRRLAVSRLSEARVLRADEDLDADAARDDAEAERPGDEGADPAAVAEPRVARRRPTSLERDARQCDELRRLVLSLGRRFGEPPTTWAGWAARARRLLEDLLGGPLRRAEWRTDEVMAFEAVAEALGALGALDWVAGPPPGLAEFRAGVLAELERSAPQTARFGHGLFTGRVGDAVGLDFDVVCVVGMTDATFPGGRGEDVLLPDHERERAGPPVPLRRTTRSEARRQFLAALAGAGERVLLYPRADQRTGRQLRPSRLVLEALEQLAGRQRTLYPSDVSSGLPADVSPEVGDRFDFVASFAAAVRDAGAHPGAPVSEADWELRSLVRWRSQHQRLGGHFLVDTAPGGGVAGAPDEVLARALDVRRHRRGSGFSRFDGLVEDVAVPSPAGGAAMSATGLESYARCPRQYLFDRLLEITVREAPEAVVQLSPMDRGTLIHSVLERLVREEVAGAAQRGGAPGSPDDGSRRERRMRAIADEECADLERRGLAGHPVLWELERARMLSDLRQFLRQDSAYRRRTGAVPVAVEAQFGWEGQREVAVALASPGRGARAARGAARPGEVSDGLPTAPRLVRFRGKIDRVDRLGVPGQLGIIDYKTGRPYGAPPADDPVERGTRLQLPVYALAARSIFAGQSPGRTHRDQLPLAGSSAVEPPSGGTLNARAGYWFVGSRGAPTWVEVDAAVQARFGQVVGAMVDGIDAGLFPANPGWTPDQPGPRRNCGLCAFTSMCAPRRGEDWDRKQRDPRLAGYVDMARPPEAEEEP